VRIAIYATLAVFIGYFAIPLLWLLLAPSQGSSEALNAHPLQLGSVHFYWRAWSRLMTYEYGQRLLLNWALNSVIYSVAAVLLATVIGIPAGYAIAFFRFPGRRLILLLTLVAMVVPQNALVLPLYIGLSKLHLVGTRWGVILPSGFFPLAVVLSYIYFSTHFPRQLLGAARIDGYGEVQLFLRVVLPLTRNVVPLIAFFAFWASWVNYFLPSVILNKITTFSLPVGIVGLAQTTNAIIPSGFTGTLNSAIGRPELAEAGLLSVLPIAIILAFSQKFLVKSPLSGAEKT
jgi:multiple sugar transport system permease protein